MNRKKVEKEGRQGTGSGRGGRQRRQKSRKTLVQI